MSETTLLAEPAKFTASARYLFLTDQELTSVRTRNVQQPINRVAWRLLAANNRPLGRSTATYPSLLECHATALDLHQRVGEASGSVLFSPDDGHWRWILRLAGEPVAEQVHTYQRRVAAHRALQQFLAVVAAVCPAPDLVRPGGRRAMTAYDRIEAAR